MTHIKHAGKPQFWYGRDGKEIVSGILGPTEAMLHHYTDVVVDTSEIAFLAKLPVRDLPELPESGWLEVGQVYQHNGVALMIRESHWRIPQDPADTPAQYMIVPWKAGVDYKVGDRVRYKDKLYECQEAHTSKVGQEPPAEPTLWKEV